MEIVKIVAFAFIALFIVTIFKGRRDDLALQVSLVAGILIFLTLISKLSAVLQVIQQLANKANIDVVYLNIIFKILAIAYLATFCSEICKDCEAYSIGSKVEFAGKILILVLAIPILLGVLQTILKIMN